MTTGDAIGANLAEVAFVIAWSGGLSAVIFGALKMAKVLRVEGEVEDTGMDSECASPKAYNIGSKFADTQKVAPEHARGA